MNRFGIMFLTVALILLVGDKPIVAQEKLLKLISVASWENIGTTNESVVFDVDIKTMKRTDDIILAYLRVTKRNTMSYEALIGDCGKDAVWTIYSFNKYANKNKLELASTADDTKPEIVKKDTIGWDILDFVCTNAKVVSGSLDDFTKETLINGRINDE